MRNENNTAMNDDQQNKQPPSTGSGQAELQQAPTPDELEQKLAEAEQKRDEYLAGWQRAKADFINYKKEELIRLAEIGKYANEELIRELIVVMDNFDLGIAAMEKAGPVEKGVYMIRAQIEDVLRKRGLERLTTKPGGAFDPAFMEAIAETDAEWPPGTVADEIEPGYRLNERVIRPVRVRLVKEKS
jgi:molecular chaperone GrpE